MRTAVAVSRCCCPDEPTPFDCPQPDSLWEDSLYCEDDPAVESWYQIVKIQGIVPGTQPAQDYFFDIINGLHIITNATLEPVASQIADYNNSGEELTIFLETNPQDELQVTTDYLSVPGDQRQVWDKSPANFPILCAAQEVFDAGDALPPEADIYRVTSAVVTWNPGIEPANLFPVPNELNWSLSGPGDYTIDYFNDWALITTVGVVQWHTTVLLEYDKWYQVYLAPCKGGKVKPETALKCYWDDGSKSYLEYGPIRAIYKWGPFRIGTGQVGTRAVEVGFEFEDDALGVYAVWLQRLGEDAP